MLSLKRQRAVRQHDKLKSENRGHERMLDENRSQLVKEEVKERLDTEDFWHSATLGCAATTGGMAILLFIVLLPVTAPIGTVAAFNRVVKAEGCGAKIGFFLLGLLCILLSVGAWILAFPLLLMLR